ncbi:hypothetical protein T484DRAFT_1801759 [Baffinella frigidus]|nr:hypothetical protein T484DRAFT_1801759 [Cryptophyta sp. CCMP2293]
MTILQSEDNADDDRTEMVHAINEAKDVVEMLLFRMAFQRDPDQTRHSARVEVTGPQLRMVRRAATEKEAGNSPRALAAGHPDDASSSSIPNSLGAPFARTRKVLQEMAQMVPGSPTPLSRRPSSVSAAPGAPSALLVQAFHAWTARTFPAGDGRDVATLLGQNRQLAAALKRQEQLAAAGAASSIDAPHGAAETSSAVGEHEAEVGQLRTQLATAGAERLLLIERA